MTLLQFGIGALNDVVDATADAGRKPGKPIPAGVVTGDAARAMAIGAFVVGVLVAAAVRPLLAGLAVPVIAIGAAYDLRAKGTAWSWVPFAIGIPLLPAFGWVAATGGLDPVFAAIIPAAVIGGAALAIGNSLVDAERDLDAGRASVAVVLGRVRATLIGVTAVVAVTTLAAGLGALGGGAPGEIVAVIGAGGIAAAGAAAGASVSPERREWGWRAEAIGLGLLALVSLRIITA
jgi:4-hydroxybenzoate polyprenyltransferase